MRKIIFLLFALLASTHTMKAQEIALKTNLVYDALLTVNLGAEAKIAPRWSVDLSGNFNAWTLDHGKKWKHWMVQPEARYWFCDAMAGHFVAAHALGGQYNVGMSTWAASTSSVPISKTSRTTATRDGMADSVWPTVTRGS